MSDWLARQQPKLVPVDYYMATFTLPEGLRALALQQPTEVYDALFQPAAETLKPFGRNHRQLNAELGFCAVLHTHSRRLDHHPHLHVVIPGGGVDVAPTQCADSGASSLGATYSMVASWRSSFAPSSSMG